MTHDLEKDLETQTTLFTLKLPQEEENRLDGAVKKAQELVHKISSEKETMETALKFKNEVLSQLELEKNQLSQNLELAKKSLNIALTQNCFENQAQ